MIFQLVLMALLGLACCALAVFLTAKVPLWISARRGSLMQAEGLNHIGLMARPGVSSSQLLIVTGLSFCLIVLAYRSDGVRLVFVSLFMALSYAAAAIDSRTERLFDDLVQPMLWIGLIVNSFGVFTSLHSALAGAVLAYLFMWLVATIAKIFTRGATIGRGDFKFMAAIGAWFGYQVVLPTLALAGIALAIYAAYQRSSSDKQSALLEYPMGPFLAGSGLFVQLIFVELFALEMPLNVGRT